MTSTINGIGTTFAGKSNLFKRTGICENCQNETTLESYDTRYCFCIIYIPVIPFGKKRITDMCRSCSYHYVTSLDEHNELKTSGVQEALENFKAEPTNSQKLQEAIATVTSAQDEKTVDILAQSVDKFLPNDVDVLMMMASAWSYFNRDDEAKDLYKRALVIQPDNREVKEILSFFLMDDGEVSEAEKMISHVLEEKIEEKAGYGVALVESYLRAQDPGAASVYIEKLKESFPFLLKEKEFKKLNKLVSKGKTLPAVKKDKSKGSSLKEGGGGIGRFAPFVIIPVVFIIYLVSSFVMGQNHTIRFVNGIDAAYKVKVEGKEYDLSPNTIREISVGSGPIQFEAVDPKFKNFKGQFQVHDSIWTRPFSSDVHVVNPDKCAVLLWEQIPYEVNSYGSGNAGYKERLELGKSYYLFASIDYAFKQSPESISTESNSTVYKTRISLNPRLSPEDFRAFLEMHHVESPEVIKACLEAKALGNPEEAVFRTP